MKLKVIQCDRHLRFYCYYCDHDITPDDGEVLTGRFYCKYCTFPVQYLCDSTSHIASPDIDYIQFLINGYLIELDINHNQSILFGKVPKLKKILTLKYLINIRPATGEYWLEKLQNLVVFS